VRELLPLMEMLSTVGTVEERGREEPTAAAAAE
jgi:hypothetical protein